MKRTTALYIAWIQSVLAMAGSLYSSQILHWTPCVLCWYQRILMYPLVLIIAVCILREVEDVEYIVLPFSIIGLGVSFYHNLLMYRILPESFAPCTASASCTIPYHFYLSFITLPLLSFLAFLVVTVCMFVYHNGKKKQRLAEADIN